MLLPARPPPPPPPLLLAPPPLPPLLPAPSAPPQLLPAPPPAPPTSPLKLGARGAWHLPRQPPSVCEGSGFKRTRLLACFRQSTSLHSTSSPSCARTLSTWSSTGPCYTASVFCGGLFVRRKDGQPHAMPLPHGPIPQKPHTPEAWPAGGLVDAARREVGGVRRDVS